MSEEMAKEDLALEKHWRILVGRRGFVMAMAGRRTRNGVETDEPCVVVTVRKKIPLCKLTEEERIPDALPDGTPIDVVESTEFSAQ